MKLTFAFLLFAGLSAHAECLRIQQNQSPSQIGNVQLSNPATLVCFENYLQSEEKMFDQIDTVEKSRITFVGSVSHDIGWAETIVQDEVLAEFHGVITSQTRCATLCQQDVTIESGGSPVSDTNPAGTRISVSLQNKPELGVKMGTMTVQAGKDFPKKYIVIGDL